ncbi:MAG TPA: hypothetical protein HPP83_10675 [Candidatus Hydrogenedentes bacterium]|nr:hypothetical protein [Candidatus Hydrogenedentota bacterium]
MGNEKRLRALHAGLVVLVLAVYVYLGLSQLLPEDVVQWYGVGKKPSVLKVHRFAAELAERPIWEIHRHLVYLGHDPAMFQLLAVALIKAGFSINDLQMAGLAARTVALLLFYFLVRAVFRQRWIALCALLYLSLCPAFVVSATSIHASGYGRLFSLGAVLAYLYYLRTSRKALLVITVVSYFLACWNYWQWHIETGILLAGVHYLERKALSFRDVARIAITPIAAFGSFYALFAVHKGGLANAGEWLLSVVAFRTLDRTHGAGYYGGQYDPGHFLNTETIGTYLQVVAERIEKWYYLSPAVLAVMLAVVLFVRRNTRDNSSNMLFFMLLAAFYWHFLFPQHVVIHWATATYHCVFVATLFGCFVIDTPAYLYRRLEPGPFRKTIAVLALFPVVFPVVGGTMADVLPRHRIYTQGRQRITDFLKSVRTTYTALSPVRKAPYLEEFYALQETYYFPEALREELWTTLSVIHRFDVAGLRENGKPASQDAAAPGIRLRRNAVISSPEFMLKEGKYRIEVGVDCRQGLEEKTRILVVLETQDEQETQHSLAVQAFDLAGPLVQTFALDDIELALRAEQLRVVVSLESSTAATPEIYVSDITIRIVERDLSEQSEQGLEPTETDPSAAEKDMQEELSHWRPASGLLDSG